MSGKTVRIRLSETYQNAIVIYGTTESESEQSGFLRIALPMLDAATVLVFLEVPTRGAMPLKNKVKKAKVRHVWIGWSRNYCTTPLMAKHMNSENKAWLVLFSQYDDSNLRPMR